ncbi:MAG: site-specific integrase [Clostridiales bacterium]|nr:site-specific integrase [Clostridiales bacterium]
MAGKAAKGMGTIRKKVVERNGKSYTYFEARVTVGRDPGTGKQVQRSFTGKTQKEVREKMQAAAVAVNTGSYVTPQKMTVGQWMDAWAADYLAGAKPATVTIYKNNIKNHIKPALGAVALSDLRPHMVQSFINGMELSPASVRLAYKVLHMALEKAVKLEYIPKNPATGSELPKLDPKEIHPLDDQQVAALLNAARGGDMEHLITVALFAGCRLSELLGLTWDAVDFKQGTITINKQLARPEHRGATPFISPKNGKARTITPAVSVMTTLKRQKRRQLEQQLKAGPLWDNPYHVVFSTEIGEPLDQWKAEKEFSVVLKAAGLTGVRFHDLRHTYAVNAIRAGDDIKTIQGNLGHASAAFTLDRYGHFTERMKQDSAARMEGFMKNVLNL